jgi:hypothetical protein
VAVPPKLVLHCYSVRTVSKPTHYHLCQIWTQTPAFCTRFWKCFWFRSSYVHFAPNPQKKNHVQLRSGLQGDHFAGPRRPIHRAAKWLASHSWLGKVKYVGAPLYIRLFIIVPLTNNVQREISAARCVSQHLT